MGISPKHSEAQPNRYEAISRFQAGFSILLEAYDYARQLQRPAWDFAVEIHCLRETGLSNSDLRLLACQQLVEHAAEMNRAGQEGRVFQTTGPLTFTNRTCFVLTETGAALARQARVSATSSPQVHDPPIATAGLPPVPKWDKQRQELRLGKLVVKQFKVPAPNQETILAAFEEEHWPPRIEDPLPPQPDQDAKRRLHDTINTLNRHQRHQLIHFLGDGTGEGVRWQLSLARPDSGDPS
jgi:hypothetical protein